MLRSTGETNEIARTSPTMTTVAATSRSTGGKFRRMRYAANVATTISVTVKSGLIARTASSATAMSTVANGQRQRENGAMISHTTPATIVHTGTETLTTPSNPHAANTPARMKSRVRSFGEGVICGIAST